MYPVSNTEPSKRSRPDTRAGIRHLALLPHLLSLAVIQSDDLKSFEMYSRVSELAALV
jgi:hypothetical protein